MTDKFLATLERLVTEPLNRLLVDDAEVARHAARLEGRRVAVQLNGHSRRLCVAFEHGELRLEGDAAAVVDVEIHGALPDLLHYAQRSRSGQSPEPGRVQIQGDAAVAQELQRLMAAVNIDVGGALATLIGDVAAHRVTRGLRAVLSRVREEAAGFEEDLSDFLLHEARLAPTRQDVDALGRSAADLEADLDRIEQRLRALHQRRHAR